MLENFGAEIFDLFSGNDPLEPFTDWASGYTSANAANRFAAENMGLQQVYNRENMAREQEYNLANMAKTDEYQRAMMSDSPSIQVAALRKAGLNPLLAVNNGISSAQTAVSATNPRSASPLASMPNVSNQIGVGDIISAATSAGNLINSSRLADAQIADFKASAALKMADTLNKPSVKANIDADTRKKGVETITRGIDSATGAITGAAAAHGARKAARIMSKNAPSTTQSVLDPVTKFGLLGLPFMMSAAGAATLIGTENAANKLSPKGQKIHRAAQGNLMNILP